MESCQSFSLNTLNHIVKSVFSGHKSLLNFCLAYPFLLYSEDLMGFYPTALQGRWGIVFTYGVMMAGGWRETVYPCCISETVRCRKLILVRPCFDLAVVT